MLKTVYLIVLSYSCYDLSYCVLAIHRHPKGNKKHFIDDLDIALKKLNEKDMCLMIGDTNFDLLTFHTNNVPVHAKYASVPFSNGFLPAITFPTRLTWHSATLIDHIFVKSPCKNPIIFLTYLVYFTQFLTIKHASLVLKQIDRLNR